MCRVLGDARVGEEILDDAEGVRMMSRSSMVAVTLRLLSVLVFTAVTRLFSDQS